MQHSLATNIGELEQLKTEMTKHGEELGIAYEKAQKANRMKTAFMHNMTNQMLEPSEAISRDVDTLCKESGERRQESVVQLADDIQRNGTTIADLLKNLLSMSDEDIRKEADNV